MREDKGLFGRIHILLWIVALCLVAFIYLSVANYFATIEYAGQVPPEVRNGQFAEVAFILGFSGFLITARRKYFAEDRSLRRPGNWGRIFGFVVIAFFWGLSAWFFTQSY